MTTLGRTEIARKTINTRNEMGTDHPVVAMVVRDADIRGVSWIVDLVYNGIAEYHQSYQTRREAVADYNTFGSDPDA